MTHREVVQKDALSIATQHARCGLAVSMGVGKTRIAIKHFQKYYDPFIKALIVIPKLSVKEAWIAELKKMNLEQLEKHFTFTTYLSINKHNPMEYQITEREVSSNDNINIYLAPGGGFAIEIIAK